MKEKYLIEMLYTANIHYKTLILLLVEDTMHWEQWTEHRKNFVQQGLRDGD